jgi:hypothetical protein
LNVALLEALPAPPANADNFWTLEVTSVEGDPIDDAEVVAVPFMVDHGHGSPSQVGVALGEGRYELGPLYHFMPGFWEIAVKISAPGEDETATTFAFCVPPG